MPKASAFIRAKLVVGLPYAWLVVFFLVPFLIVLKISLSQTAIAQPPYTPVFDLAAGWHGVCEISSPALSLDNYGLLGSDPLYMSVLCEEPGDRRVLDAAAARHRLSDRLRHHAHAAALAGRAGPAGHAAVLDLVSHPHLCLDEHSAA